jgi:hypothetical protein
MQTLLFSLLPPPKALYDFTISAVAKAANINVIQQQSSPNSFV